MSAAERLAELLRIPTVSRLEGRDEAAFAAFRARLEQYYPRTHALEHETVGAGALLFRWPGGADAPIVLMAHYDVVPVEGQPWSRDPFGGAIEGGAVHGRGALDDKGALVAILEAVESLLGEGRRPAGEVFLAFGDDEEVGGAGARAIAARLAERGVRPELVLDEGGAIVEGMLPGVRGAVAVVGLAEKSAATLRLTATGAAGHASAPPRRTAPGRLARALVRIERRPFPARADDLTRAMLRALGTRLPAPVAGVAASRAGAALLGPLLGRVGGTLAALVRTTVAVTEVRGGSAPNVLAAEASAVLNVRLAPADTLPGVVERLRRIIGDPEVRIGVLSGAEPSRISRTDGPGWRRLTAALAVAAPEVLPVPYLMVQASDARHFTALSEGVYRFVPFRITAGQLAAVHGPDEHLDVAALDAGVAFYRALITGA